MDRARLLEAGVEAGAELSGTAPQAIWQLDDAVQGMIASAVDDVRGLPPRDPKCSWWRCTRSGVVVIILHSIAR